MLSDSKFAFRIDPEDRKRLARAAEAERLCAGAFVRTHIMKKVEQAGF